MSMESLEFIIYPDGRVMEKVTGIVKELESSFLSYTTIKAAF